MLSNQLNATDWTKQLISKIIQISHSQWIYKNNLLHNHNQGYLHKNNTEQIAEKIHLLAELEPEDVPVKSRFLLEMNLGDLTKLHLKTKSLLDHSSYRSKISKSKKISNGS